VRGALNVIFKKRNKYELNARYGQYYVQLSFFEDAKKFVSTLFP